MTKAIESFPAEEVLKLGHKLLEPVVNKMKEWSSAAKEYLESGESSAGIWGYTPDVGQANAREVLEKAARILEKIRQREKDS